MPDAKDMENRLRVLEMAFAKHEAACGQRQERITEKLNIILSLVGIILGALVVGHPLIEATRAWLGKG